MTYGVIWLLCLLAFARAAPVGIQGDVVCKPTTWHDVIVFLLGNFVAHVATIPQTPGTKWYISLQWSLIALLLPFVTLASSIFKLCDHFTTGGNDFKDAYAARALVVVIRTPEWKPDSGFYTQFYPHERLTFGIEKPSETDRIMNSDENLGYSFSGLENPDSADVLSTYDVFGNHSLPPGYRLVIAEPQTVHSVFFKHLRESVRDISLSRSRSWVKMGAGLAQLIFSCVTLFNSRGDQFDKFGYASFGLYVFPFALMSFVNLICVGVVGDYSCLYVVRTSVLLEAEKRGGHFDGAVGEVYEEQDYEPLASSDRKKVSVKADGDGLLWRLDEKERKQAFVPDESALGSVIVPAYFDECTDAPDGYRQILLKTFKTFFVAYGFIIVTPYLVLYAFSRFHTGGSTSQQRGWLISWVVCNQIGGLAPILMNTLRTLANDNWMVGKKTRITTYSIMIPLSVAAIGGYYTIISELLEFGTCVAL